MRVCNLVVSHSVIEVKLKLPGRVGSEVTAAVLFFLQGNRSGSRSEDSQTEALNGLQVCALLTPAKEECLGN